jgi:hypothetical protein
MHVRFFVKSLFMSLIHRKACPKCHVSRVFEAYIQ